MRKIATSTLCLLMLGGCAFRGDMQRVAVDQNRLVADATNAATLLNILRAKNHEPLHFTTFNELRGTMTATIGAKASLALPSDALDSTINGGTGGVTSFLKKKAIDTATPSFESSLSTTPGFTMGVHATEKFQRGIMQPLPAAQLDYFLQAGWPQELITAMFIERIDFLDQNGEISLSIHNDPDEFEQSCAFRNFVDNFRLEARPQTGRIIEIAPLASMQAGMKLSDYSIVDGKTIDLVDRKDVLTLVRTRPDAFHFRFVDKHDDSESHDMTKETLIATCSTSFDHNANQVVETMLFRSGIPQDDAMPVQSGISVTQKGVTNDNLKPRIVTRSILGMFYFVGEYLRPEVQYPLRGKTDMSLIKVREGASSAAISATYRGKRWVIDEWDKTSRSLQVIDLLQQLLNMQKSADDLPVSRTVTVAPG